jgi:hypothetical protein
MQPITGKVHGLRRLSLFEPGESVFDCVDQVGTYPAAVPALIKSFEAAMLDAPDHRGTR